MKRSEWRVRAHSGGDTPATDGAPGKSEAGHALTWQDEEVYQMLRKYGRYAIGLLEGVLATIDVKLNDTVVQATKPFDEYPPNILRALESLKEYRRQKQLSLRPPRASSNDAAPAGKRRSKLQGRGRRGGEERHEEQGPPGDSLADDRRVDAGDGDDIGEVVDGDASFKGLKRSGMSLKVAGGDAACKGLKSSARGKPAAAADKPEGMAGGVRKVGVSSGVFSSCKNRVAGKGSHRSNHRRVNVREGGGNGEKKAAGERKAAGGDGERKSAGGRKSAGERGFCSTKAGRRSRATMRCLEQSTRERLCEIAQQAEEANRRAVEAKRALVDKYYGILKEKLAQGVEEERRMIAEVVAREEAKLRRLAGLL
ncbi:unnamed protein product [Closterium sp. Yama58-4]|nr:unnamed protein product [Closterium sp. Yama58-4]